MTKIYNCLPRPARGEKYHKMFSEEHNRMARVRFEPRPCRPQPRRSSLNHADADKKN